MQPTAFTPILVDLVARVPGAFACALVDGGGETVDHVGEGDGFETQVAAAHVQILLRMIEGNGAIGVPRSLVIRGANRTFIGRRLPEDYALVVLVRRRAGIVMSERAFASCERALAAEAGWKRSEGNPRWFPVAVQVDSRGRPVAIGTSRIEILGTVVGSPRKERSYRARIANKQEFTLRCERLRAWYADEDLREPIAPSSTMPPSLSRGSPVRERCTQIPSTNSTHSKK